MNFKSKQIHIQTSRMQSVALSGNSVTMVLTSDTTSFYCAGKSMALDRYNGGGYCLLNQLGSKLVLYVMWCMFDSDVVELSAGLREDLHHGGA